MEWYWQVLLVLECAFFVPSVALVSVKAVDWFGKPLPGVAEIFFIGIVAGLFGPIFFPVTMMVLSIRSNRANNR